MPFQIPVKKTHENARIPTRGTPDSAGYDLYSAESGTIPPLSRKLIATGIQMAIPKNHYGRIAPRSGLAYKNGIDVMAGVIDADYRNNIGVILYNSDSTKTFEYMTGDRIAQLIITPYASYPLVETETLNQTERGEGGYGSTGK